MIFLFLNTLEVQTCEEGFEKWTLFPITLQPDYS